MTDLHIIAELRRHNSTLRAEAVRWQERAKQAETLLAALVKREPSIYTGLWDAEKVCAYCDAFVDQPWLQLIEHAPACPWERARRAVRGE